MAMKMNNSIHKPMSIFQILKEAMKIPSVNWNFASFIFLLNFIAYSILLFVIQFTGKPIILELDNIFSQLTANPPKDQELLLLLLLQAIKDGLRSLIIFLLLAQVVTLVISVITVTAISGMAAAQYHCKEFGFSHLFWKIKTSWKGIIFTFLYLKLLTLGYMTALYLLVVMSYFITSGSVWFIVLYMVVICTSLLLLIRLIMTWWMGLVTAVTEEEEGCGGLVALGIGARVIEERWLQGYALSFYIAIVSIALSMVYSFAIVSGHHPSDTMMLAIGIVFGIISIMWSLFGWGILSIYYCDCKEGRGEEKGNRAVDAIRGFEYSKIPEVSTVIEEFP